MDPLIILVIIICLIGIIASVIAIRVALKEPEEVEDEPKQTMILPSSEPTVLPITQEERIENLEATLSAIQEAFGWTNGKPISVARITEDDLVYIVAVETPENQEETKRPRGYQNLPAILPRFVDVKKPR